MAATQIRKENARMDRAELLQIISLGKDSKNQFKEKINSSYTLAAEIGAFANSQGGRIIVGVSDEGNVIGLTKEEVAKLNQMISNVCSQKIDPPINAVTENIRYEDKVVVIINIPMGVSKFYISNGTDIWIKVAADKRRAKREEMYRLMQESSILYADEQPILGTNINDLDLKLVIEFTEKKFEDKVENLPYNFEVILNNMKILYGESCTLGGMMLFGKGVNTTLIQYGIGAVSWFGNEISGTEYRDSQDIVGNASKLIA